MRGFMITKKILVFIFAISLIFPISSAETKCTQIYTKNMDNSLLPWTTYSATGHCIYEDGTRSASDLTCFKENCCEHFLNGTHTKGEMQYKTWRNINQLNCIDSEGKSKTYINGEDINNLNKPTIENLYIIINNHIIVSLSFGITIVGIPILINLIIKKRKRLNRIEKEKR